MRRPKHAVSAPMDDRSSIGGVKVEHRKVDARALVTIDAAHDVWNSTADIPDCEGRIFRLCPPADASAELVQRVRAELLERGAAAAKVAPRANGNREVPEVVKVQAPRAPREAVMELVEAARVDDREALRAECEQVLGEVGL